jgi:hypothetical protein
MVKYVPMLIGITQLNKDKQPVTLERRFEEMMNEIKSPRTREFVIIPDTNCI